MYSNSSIISLTKLISTPTIAQLVKPLLSLYFLIRAVFWLAVRTSAGNVAWLPNALHIARYHCAGVNVMAVFASNWALRAILSGTWQVHKTIRGIHWAGTMNDWKENECNNKYMCCKKLNYNFYNIIVNNSNHWIITSSSNGAIAFK